MEFQFRTVSERDDSDSRLDVGALWAMGRKRLARMGALEAFDAAVRLLVVFLASGAVVIAYAIWAMGYSGVALPSVPLSLHRDGNTVTGTATMTLGSAMKPLRLGLAEQLHSRPDSRFSIQVHDARGGLVYESSSTHSGIMSAPDHVMDWTSTMGTIDVPQDGTYLFTCRWDSTEPGRVIEGAGSVRVLDQGAQRCIVGIAAGEQRQDAGGNGGIAESGAGCRKLRAEMRPVFRDIQSAIGRHAAHQDVGE